MLKRLYIDNYLCLSNFEWRPGARVLLAGRNGSGKSSMMDVLWKLRQLLTEQLTVESLFPTQTLTAWDSRDKQTFELSIDGNGQEYEYRLLIEHDRDQQDCRVFHERLSTGNSLIYEYKDSQAKMFWDDGSDTPPFPTGSSRSLISTLPDHSNNQRLFSFRNRMRRVYLFALEPLGMSSRSLKEARMPNRGLNNIASWMRHLQAEDSIFAARLIESLKPLLPGFSHFGLKAGVGEERSLTFHFSAPGNSSESYEVPFHELSDGQRALTALYIILHAVVKRDTTICFDEPDNFVSLREIQPWLLQLEDKQEETGCQCLFISHHPEVIDLLTPMEETVLLERDNGGVVRLKPFEWGDSDGVNASELMARGWESNE